jgi:hypothetical protein
MFYTISPTTQTCRCNGSSIGNMLAYFETKLNCLKLRFEFSFTKQANLMSRSTVLSIRRHNTQHNDTQQDGLIWDTEHN